MQVTILRGTILAACVVVFSAVGAEDCVVDPAEYGFSPDAAPDVNRQALQRALDGGRRTCCEKWVYSEKRYLPESRDTNDVKCVFSASEIPSPFQEVVFTVTPYNAFGVPGEPISAPLNSPIRLN